MGVAKTGPKLVVDHNITYQLISMDAFWEAGTQELKDELWADARDAIAKASDAVAGRQCTGCTTLKAAITPVHDKLWGWIDRAIQLGVPVTWLTEFVAAKRGYRPARIEVYYKDINGFRRTLVL